MPTAIATVPPNHGAVWPAELEDKLNAMLADLNRQVEIALVCELAGLPPGDRRLFRAELGLINTYMDHDQSTGVIRMRAECTPPKTWLVERGSDDDTMSDEQAAVLVKAGAVACRFDTDGDGGCAMALCDYCHPEAWV